MNISIFSHNFGVNLRCVGIALSIAGVPLGMYMNHFIVQMDWNTYLMFSSLLLIPNWKNLASWRLPTMSTNMRIVMAFLILCVFYAIFFPAYSAKGADYIKKYVLFYICYAIIFCIELGTIQKYDIDFHRIIKFSWIISIVTTLCSLYCIRKGVYDVNGLRTVEDTVLSSLTMGYGGVVGFICSLYLPTGKSSLKKIISVSSAVLCFVVVACIGKRTPFLICLFVFFFYLKNFNPLRSKKTALGLMAMLILIGLYVILIPTEDLFNRIDTVYQRSSAGIVDMAKGTTTSGTAASARYHARIWFFDLFATKYTLVDAIFGCGFMKSWLDIPTLQIYLDMGIVGFIVYNFYVVIFPLYAMFKRKFQKNKDVLFAAALCTYSVFATLNSGHPYNPQKWLPCLFLLFTINYFRKLKSA